MRKTRLSIVTLLLLFVMTFAFPLAVYADGDNDDASEAGIRLGTGDAVNDILMDNRFEGAIESISFVTKFVDHWFTVIITATAFFIISAAMLKNVMAGAYCSNQKFWNKVAEAHEKADAVSLATIGGYISGKQFLNTTGGGLADALLGLIPNIKAWTDFDDAEIEPKHYFMKAIPQMLACIIIGVFIYNGYYRNTAATVGDFGSEVCNRLFSSINPAKMVDTITLTNRTPDNIYSGDPTIEGQYRLTISKEAYKLMVSSFSDYTTTEQKTGLMRNCEKLAQIVTRDDKFNTKLLKNIDTENKEYKMSNLKVRLTPSNDCPVTLSPGSIVWVGGDLQTDADETTFMAGYIKTEDVGLSPVGMSPASNDTFYITGSFKKVARTSNVSKALSDLTSDGSKGANSFPGIPAEALVAGKFTGTGEVKDTCALKDSEAKTAVVTAIRSAVEKAGYTIPDNVSDDVIAANTSGRVGFDKGATKGSLLTTKISVSKIGEDGSAKSGTLTINVTPTRKTT